jgi:hypothetical protein
MPLRGLMTRMARFWPPLPEVETFLQKLQRIEIRFGCFSRTLREAGEWPYRNAPNPAHRSASGGIVLPSVFKSTRITLFSVAQNKRLPV